MGFGILFFGYFLAFAFSISKVYFFADVIGGIVMLYAFTKLMQYNRYYVGAIYSTALFTLFSTVSAIFLTLKISSGSVVDMALNVAKAVSACVMQICIFLGVRGISLGAECGKLVNKSERSIKLTSAYYIISLFVLFTGSFYDEIASYISVWVYIYWWVCFILNLALIYQAFGMLYSEDEELAEKKRSRFKIINYINDKMDAFEENSNRYRRESMEMALDEAERLHKDNGHKKSKKKKKK